MSVRSDSVPVLMRVVALAWGLTNTACGSTHSTMDAGEADSAATIDAVFSAPDTAESLDAAAMSVDAPPDASPPLDASEETDVFVCRSPGSVCFFAEDCCVRACIIEPGFDEGFCV